MKRITTETALQIQMTLTLIEEEARRARVAVCASMHMAAQSAIPTLALADANGDIRPCGRPDSATLARMAREANVEGNARAGNVIHLAQALSEILDDAKV